MHKLVRDKSPKLYKGREFRKISNQDELNNLYHKKMIEEVAEIKDSDFLDCNEYADLIQVAISCAEMNGISAGHVLDAVMRKAKNRGVFTDLVMDDINPNKPTNKIYFQDV